MGHTKLLFQKKISVDHLVKHFLGARTSFYVRSEARQNKFENHRFNLQLVQAEFMEELNRH